MQYNIKYCNICNNKIKVLIIDANHFQALKTLHYSALDMASKYFILKRLSIFKKQLCEEKFFLLLSVSRKKKHIYSCNQTAPLLCSDSDVFIWSPYCYTIAISPNLCLWRHVFCLQ